MTVYEGCAQLRAHIGQLAALGILKGRAPALWSKWSTLHSLGAGSHSWFAGLSRRRHRKMPEGDGSPGERAPGADWPPADRRRRAPPGGNSCRVPGCTSPLLASYNKVRE